MDRIAFSTLNYECVLEYSLLDAGIRIDYFGPGESESVPIWKLHGSCNMFCHQLRATEGISYTKGILRESFLKEVWKRC